VGIVNDAVALPDLDPIDRLTILAAALPGAVVRQRQIAAPFDAVWRVIADLEHATPRYEPGVAHLRVIERHGQFLRLLVQDTAGREEMMDARLRPGWCLMQSATVVVAFAARRLGARPCWPISNTSACRLPRQARASHTTAGPPRRKSTRNSKPSNSSPPRTGSKPPDPSIRWSSLSRAA
jgi:hypothetical protein